jgi:hypothetical protein
MQNRCHTLFAATARFPSKNRMRAFLSLVIGVAPGNIVTANPDLATKLAFINCRCRSIFVKKASKTDVATPGHAGMCKNHQAFRMISD